MSTEFRDSERQAKPSMMDAFLTASHGDRLANTGTLATYAGGISLSAVELVGQVTHTVPALGNIGLGPLVVVSMLTGWRIFVGRQSESDKLRHEREQAAEAHRHAEEVKRLEVQHNVSVATKINAVVSAHVHGIRVDAETGLPVPEPAIITPAPFPNPDTIEE
jgi:hypothetical protein